jgi:polyhydroxyalkanoate synthesis regulator phasin
MRRSSGIPLDGREGHIDQYEEAAMTDSTESTPIEDPDTESTPEGLSGDAGFIESVFLLGLGAASATRDAVESLSKDLVERGKLSQQDASKFAQDLARRADASTKGMQDKAREGSGKAAGMAGVATKDDVARIEKDIAEIKDMLSRSAPVSSDEPYTP